jgi:DNA-binding Lrp family transcriptional regulator
MDRLDKQLLLKLLCNCRLSYRQLADELGVTCPTIKRRVDLLMEAGIVKGFTVELSQETLGVNWVIAEITTDMTEDRAGLIADICSHHATEETFAVGSNRYFIFAEVSHPEGTYEYGKYLRSLQRVETLDIECAQQIPTSQLSHRCKYNSRGRKVEFSPEQLETLKYLAGNARMPIQDLAEKTGFKPKRLRRILRELKDEGGVHFTISLNPCSRNCISFILRMTFDETLTSSEEVVSMLEEDFPLEYWMTFMLTSRPVLVNYMTCYNLAKVENLLRRMKQIPYLYNVETMLIYHIEKPQENGVLLTSS